jgi:phospholipid/cholesterol/gamma-HCH transport system substrate-binding protein
MKNTLETRLGIFVALAVIAAVLILETVGGIEMFRRGRTVTALFANVQELKVGDRVKMAGVEIGRVQAVTLTNSKVLVVMKLHADDAPKVRTDSKATVRFTGLMGQNFVAISFGSPSSPVARENTPLDADEQADLNEMMQKVEKVAAGVQRFTDSISGDTIDNLLGPLTDFLKANRGPLTATFTNLQFISTQIAQGRGTVGKLINEDTLYNSALTTITNLQDTGADVKLTLADARKVVDQVNSMVAQVSAGKGTIGKLLTDETLYSNLADASSSLKEIFEKVNKGDGSVGKLINDQEFYRNAKLTLQKLDQATEGLEDSGPLSVLGTIVGKLF